MIRARFPSRHLESALCVRNSCVPAVLCVWFFHSRAPCKSKLSRCSLAIAKLSTHEPVEEVAIAQIVSNSGPSPHVSASAIAYCDELALQLIARAKKLKGDGDTAGEAAFTDSFYK